MLRFFAILVALFTAFPAVASNQVTACRDDVLHAVSSITELPEQVQDLLGRFRPGISRMADVGEKFNKFDVIVDDAPMNRLISAQTGDHCILALVEHGGRGYWREEIIFQRNEGKWSKSAKKSIPVRQ
jgi:hypothetical protein